MFVAKDKLNIAKVIELYKQSEQLRNPKAMMALGRIFELGIGVKANMEEATRYYEAAASYDQPYALYWMGNVYEQDKHPDPYKGGKGLEREEGKNFQWAFLLYKKATEVAEQHDRLDSCNEAHFKLGYFYQHGIKVEKDIQQAIREYFEAACNGHEDSMNALGSVLYNEQKNYI
jgi:TPR repeat protein